MRTVQLLRPRRGARIGVGAVAALGLLGLIVHATAIRLHAQTAPLDGVREVDPRWHAIVNATLVPRPGERIDDATIVLRDGVVVSVESGAEPPAGARVWDYDGLTVYAGLIDAHIPVEAPRPGADAPGAHWNSRVIAQRSALDGEGVSKSKRESLRKMGFGAGAIVPTGGVFRGQVAVALLDDPERAGSESRAEVVAPVTHHAIAFETGRWGERTYPNSQMGAIALIRQTLLDADWHIRSLNVYQNDPTRHEPPTPARALLALGRNEEGSFPLMFNVGDELEALRAAKIAREFDRRFAIVGSGTEFRRLDALRELEAPLITPLSFPEAPGVASQGDIESVTLRELMTWEQAPTNPRRLADAGLTVALTTDKLRRGARFMDNLRLAIEHGLSEERALAMLTTNPAAILGVEDRLGAVEPGKIANLVAIDGESLFHKDAKVRDVWVAGRRHEITAKPDVQFAGSWDATIHLDPAAEVTLTIDDRNRITVKTGEKSERARSVSMRENRVNFVVGGVPLGAEGAWTFSAIVERDMMHGTAIGPDGRIAAWIGERSEPASSEESTDTDAKEDADDDKEKSDEPASRRAEGVPDELPMPLGAYGLAAAPESEDLVITGATIWTAGPEGIIENGVMVVVDGKIAHIGGADSEFESPAGARTIDAKGKHITPGMIDCHSHTGISGGVNEGTHAVTAEVRIADVINPDSVDFYRQLAGGLTVANQLHGSANPIGGQNSVIKLRWGATHAEDMLIEDAAQGIKFALGENVKQSNWPSPTGRYPQTRMGVETIIRDRFIAARDYVAELERYEGLSSRERERTMPPRRDIQLETLAEILAGERLIHCHSYRQDEILMLARVAQEFGFRIGTFQHVLEGYKVAEAIKDVAIGASAFSDWWGFKMETFDAIPYNGAIMHDVGVNVSFNSDSNELARRMNGEAAKAVRYGGVDPHEALKFVTINPAIQLKIDHRVGSLEAGKDADFVIWSGDPLSAFSRCEATWIEGREYFSIERDQRLRDHADAERRRIIQKILSEGQRERPQMASDGDRDRESDAPAGTDEPTSLIERLQARALEQHFLELMRSGQDPDGVHCGDCGVHHAAMLVIR
ncbi:MAG: amidohydrolase [Phycisphaeraceae bacterium]|nr:MAG: amidohydrolase [Phycisphaeraceae bacterium]